MEGNANSLIIKVTVVNIVFLNAAMLFFSCILNVAVVDVLLIN
jgi:hypothetical protein